MLQRLSAGTVLRLLLITAWVGSLGLLVFRETLGTRVPSSTTPSLTKSETITYELLFDHSRIGWFQSRFSPEGSKVLLSQEGRLRLNLLGKEQEVAMHLSAELAQDLTLRRFTARLISPFYRMRAAGRMEQGYLRYRIETDKTTINNVVRFHPPPRLGIGKRPWLIAPLPEPGRPFPVPFVDPFTLAPRTATLTYHGREKVLVGGRVRELHRFSERFSGVRVESFLDDEGTVVQERSPAGFLMVRVPSRSIPRPAKGADLLASVAVELAGKRPAILDGRRVRYRLVLPQPEIFQLNSGRQRFQDGILTIEREAVGEHPAPCALDVAEPADPFVQWQHPEIKTLARKITAHAAAPLDKVRAIAAWMHANIRRQPVVGLPDALTTLKNRVGDCNEYAVLFAALARAADIPSRMVAGVALFEDRFYYHSWNEVCLGRAWVSVDATLNQVPADLGHIKFVTGGLEKASRLLALLNRLRIEGIEE